MMMMIVGEIFFDMYFLHSLFLHVLLATFKRKGLGMHEGYSDCES